MARLPGFIGPGYTLQSLAADCQRCVGWFPEINELQTQADGEIASLVQVPGLRLLLTVGTGPIRGIARTSTGKVAVVSGSEVYKVWQDSALVWQSVLAGNLSTSIGPVSMADNGSQLMLVDGPAGYIISLVDGSFTKITNEFFVGATTTVFQDGYFLANTPNTGQFGISKLYDGFTWDALDMGVAEGSADNIVAIISNNRQIWLMGELTTEVWWDSGDVNFPFTRIDGAFIEFGCVAPATALKFDNSVVWLGGGTRANGIVWMAEGFRPKRISNHAVEFAIQQLGDLSTATAYTYQLNGHSFYALNLPGSATTWVYDSATEQWSERIFWNAGVEERHRAECHALAYATHIVGDYQNGNLYALDDTVFTDNGNPIMRIRRTPHMSENMLRMFYSRLQMDMSVGVGLDGEAPVGRDPQVELRWSDDYGHTWSPFIARPMGALGAYRTLVIWRKLGQARNRVFELRVSEPVRVTLLGADITMTPGRS